MTKVVPPAPLTGIQTPRTEETGFAFPAEQKEETSFMKEIEQISLIEPFDDPEPEPKDVAQSSSKPWWDLEELTAELKIKPADCKVTDSSTYELTKQWKAANPNPQPVPAAPELVAEGKPVVADEPEKSTDDSFDNKYVSSSLQADLEMSDSDEEPVTEVKSNPEEFLTSTATDVITTNNTTISTNNNTNNNTNNTTMETNSAESSNSSSSESGDSDSDDSSSESNDSDSSSEASDEEISSKKWGLSNFVDETQRIHSPAFFQADAAAKESLRLHAERMKNLALNNANASSTTPTSIKDSVTLPVTEQSATFLVPNVPVTSKSAILSPIPSPMHPAVGPRTPPSPTGALKQDSPESNVSESQAVKSPAEAESSEDAIEPPVQNNSPQPGTPDCDLTEEKGNVQNEKCKKQLRSSNAKTEEINSEVESSPARDSSIDEHSDSKEPSEVSLEKNSTATGIEITISRPVTPEAVEPPPENYSIKTRQRGSTASSSKKNKFNVDNSSESSQKTDVANSPGIAKLKHPRACRKSNEKQNKKAGANSTSTKPDVTEQTNKRIKQDIKEIKPNSEKVKDPAKVSSTVRSGSKPGRKSKVPKLSSKQISEVKKPDTKKKKKFSIANFLQSPENESPDTTLPIFTPSPERSPIPECERSSPEETMQSSVPADIPAKTTKSSKKTVANKNVEKLRRSVRCSERASNNAQVEAPVTPQANSENVKNSKVGRPKSRVDNILSIEGVDRLELLSPIPMDPSGSTELSDCAIPLKIMVCIPLAKLTRLPAILQQTQESENIQGHRSRSASADDVKPQKKDSESPEKITKTVTAKRSQSKDVKDKSKTVPPLKNSKNNIKNVSVNKKEKINKPTNEASSKSKIASTVNKNSIKIKDKTLCDDTENTLPKKRKSEGKDNKIVKKKKVLPRTIEEKKLKDPPSVGKIDATVNAEDTNKSKTLERCDSTGSLSSLCSQQSQRSSKSTKEKKKDAPSSTPDSKRIKTASVLLKDIKQEKDDRSKIHIKKESKTADKNKGKSRDKSSVKDTTCSEKASEPLWDDSITSSQPFHWDDQCKDDSKAKLVTNQSLSDTVNRELADWDHFAPEMHKELKEASTLNKHNTQAPIMPMDYYWTEGRKQKQIAEKEKDPFQQAVKFFEAAVLFILTSQQKEEYSKDPQAIYQFYDETLKYFEMIQTKCKKLRSCPGSTEFKLLILCLKSMSLLNVKLYNIKIKEIKEQLDGVTDFLQHHYSAANTHNPNLLSRLSSLSSASSLSPHSTIPSPSNSIASSQSSGYSSSISVSETSGNHARPSSHQSVVSVPQSILDMICRQHIHLLNLHRGHDRWEQADMYMTRSNLREFFKEVADQSEPLTLHSSITELIKYIQKGISLVKKSLR